jgi:hypothetical protein
MMHELPENAQRAIKESLDKEGAAKSASQARHREAAAEITAHVR